MYYFIIKNNKIISASQLPCMDEDAINVEVTEEVFYSKDKYVYLDGEIIVDPDYEEKKKQQRRQELDAMYLTGADVERAIYKDKGLDFDDILLLLDNYPDIDKKAVKIELKANNFYRGNPYVMQIGEILGYSSDDLDYLFENKKLPQKE